MKIELVRFPEWLVRQNRFEAKHLYISLSTLGSDGLVYLSLLVDWEDETWWSKSEGWSCAYSLSCCDAASSSRHPFLGTLHRESTRSAYLRTNDNWRSVASLFRARLADGRFVEEAPLWPGPDLVEGADLRDLARRDLPELYDLSLTSRNSAVIASSSAFLRSR